MGKNFIEIRKNEVGNTDLYALWHDLDNDTIGNDDDVFPYETSQYIDTDNDGVGTIQMGLKEIVAPQEVEIQPSMYSVVQILIMMATPTTETYFRLT